MWLQTQLLRGLLRHYKPAYGFLYAPYFCSCIFYFASWAVMSAEGPTSIPNHRLNCPHVTSHNFYYVTFRFSFEGKRNAAALSHLKCQVILLRLPSDPPVTCSSHPTSGTGTKGQQLEQRFSLHSKPRPTELLKTSFNLGKDTAPKTGHIESVWLSIHKEQKYLCIELVSLQSSCQPTRSHSPFSS